MKKLSFALSVIFLIFIVVRVVNAQTPAYSCPDYSRDGKLTGLDFFYLLANGNPVPQLVQTLQTILIKYSTYCSADIPSPSPSAIPSISSQLTPKIAIRVPDTTVANELEQYRNGTKGSIRFIYYGSLQMMQTLSNLGVTQGANPAELGVLIGCGSQAVINVSNDRVSYQAAHVTYLLNDCERGPDNLWADPDVVDMATRLAPLVNGNGFDFRWHLGMQYGYLENAPNGAGGDQSVCSDPRNPYSCAIGTSYAGLAWNSHNANDILGIFGRSGSQQTPQGFMEENQPWLDYKMGNSTLAGMSWWAISGLVDKDSNGFVDLSPQGELQIAQKAYEMRAETFVIIWLGRTAAELFGPETEMDQFLDLWVSFISP